MAKLTLQVISPEKVIFEQDVDSFVVRAADGDVGIRPGHAPLFTSLQSGVMQVKANGEDTPLAVMGGFLQVQDNRATVLTESAELASTIDAARAKHAKERAEARLMERSVEVDRVRAEAALERAIVRLRLFELLRNTNKY
jgi:F-type H+-transporting ATPase subunit epsilon